MRVATSLRLVMSSPRHIDEDDVILGPMLQAVNLVKLLLGVDQVSVDVENRDVKRAALEGHIHVGFQWINGIQIIG